MSVAGADCSLPITQALINLAQKTLGAAPVVWGRYFNGFHTTSAEYVPDKEAALFRAANLKLVPVAQQTPKVGMDAATGAANAKMNVQKFIQRIGADRLAAAGTEFLMFLDVEDDASTNSPAMSADYYTGWANALVSESRNQSGNKFTIVPGVYAPRRSDDTWNALKEAEANGAEPCRAVWITRSHTDACNKPVPDWDAETAFRTPAVALSCPIVCWQFALDCPDGNGVDLDLITADDDDQKFVLDRLVVP